MRTTKIIKEISELLELDEIININETPIEFDSLSNLGLIAFLDSNFNVSVTQEEIKDFKVVNDVIKFIDERKG